MSEPNCALPLAQGPAFLLFKTALVFTLCKKKDLDNRLNPPDGTVFLLLSGNRVWLLVLHRQIPQTQGQHGRTTVHLSSQTIKRFGLNKTSFQPP